MMLKKILFFFFIINLNIYCLAEEKYKIIATVNNIPITKLDLNNELVIIEMLNNKKVTKDEISVGLNNLVEEKIKLLEIEKEKMEIDKKIIDNSYFILIKNLNLDYSKIDKKITKSIKEKIRIDRLWNELVVKKYAWKININMDEINKKIAQKKDENFDTEKYKEKLIIDEKNKKMSVYSRFYLNELKNKSLIRYF